MNPWSEERDTIIGAFFAGHQKGVAYREGQRAFDKWAAKPGPLGPTPNIKEQQIMDTQIRLAIVRRADSEYLRTMPIDWNKPLFIKKPELN